MSSPLEITIHQKKQSIFTITAIQVTGATSLPILNSSIQLLHVCGFKKAFWIVLMMNILVWLVAMGIIRMVANTTKNTLDNVRDYLGKYGAFIVGIILVIATISSFILQTNAATYIILHLINFDNSHIDRFLQIGVFLGVLSTLASMEGINGLRWVSLIAFPIILIIFLSLLSSVHSSKSSISISLTTIGSLAVALGGNLSAAVDYPTFFQHSKSAKNSIIAVSSIQFITFLIGIGGLYLGEFIPSTSNIASWDVFFNVSLFVTISFFILVVLSCLCVNMVNVYSASIAWELIVPIFAGRKEYTILGLGLTSAFILVTNLLPIQNFMIASEISLSNLCIVLIVAFIGKSWLKIECQKLDKIFYFVFWLIGSVVILVGGLPEENANIKMILIGFSCTLISTIFWLAFKKARSI